MSLTTLTGVISSSALNNNFSDKLNSLDSQAGSIPTFHQFNIETLDLTNAPAAGTNIADFTAPDDLELWVVGLSMWNTNLVSKVVTMTLTAIDSAGTSVTKYLLDQSVTVNVTGATAAEFNATRQDWSSFSGTKVFLAKGVTYRLTLTCSADTVDRAYGFIVTRVRRRRA